MRTKELRNKYPEIWDEVYKGVVDDLYDCMPKEDINEFDNGNTNCRIARISHNAAFFACDALYKRNQCKSILIIK